MNIGDSNVPTNTQSDSWIFHLLFIKMNVKEDINAANRSSEIFKFHILLQLATIDIIGITYSRDFNIVFLSLCLVKILTTLTNASSGKNEKIIRTKLFNTSTKFQPWGNEYDIPKNKLQKAKNDKGNIKAAPSKLRLALMLDLISFVEIIFELFIELYLLN